MKSIEMMKNKLPTLETMNNTVPSDNYSGVCIVQIILANKYEISAQVMEVRPVHLMTSEKQPRVLQDSNCTVWTGLFKGTGNTWWIFRHFEQGRQCLWFPV